MKCGYFQVVPEGKITLNVQGERFRLAFKKDRVSGNENDIFNLTVMVLWKLNFCYISALINVLSLRA